MAIGASIGSCGRIAVEAIFADIEKESAEIILREGGERAHIAAECEAIRGGAEFRVQFGQAMENVTLQLRHFCDGHSLALIEIAERPKHIAKAVAQLAISVGGTGQYFLADADIVEIISRGDPHRSEEHTSELQSLLPISFAVFFFTN